MYARILLSNQHMNHICVFSFPGVVAIRGNGDEDRIVAFVKYKDDVIIWDEQKNAI